MAISANAWWEIRPTAGASTNGGGFDPSIVVGATNVVTDLAATSATGNSSVVTSATYTFVAGDVGAWLFIAAGTSWIKGWYQIASVSAGAATLTAGVGTAILYQGATVQNTSAGCATTASPTGGTGSIDYTQQNSAGFALTGESSATTTVTCTASVATPMWIGNAAYLSGTGITTGRYFVTGVGTLVAGLTSTFTVDRSPGTTGTSVVVNIGGALDTNNTAFGTTGGVGSNAFWLKQSGVQVYAGAQTAMPNGASGAMTVLWGYNLVRGDLDSASVFTNHPEIQSNNVANAALNPGTSCCVRNVWVDGGSAGTKANNGFVGNTTNTFINCKASGCNSNGFIFGIGDTASRCYATGGSGVGYSDNGGTRVRLIDCVASAMANNGYAIAGATTLVRCIATSVTGATSDGFQITGSAPAFSMVNCASYNNARDGIRGTVTGCFDGAVIRNCIIAKNGGTGLNSVSTNYKTQQGSLDSDYNFFWSNTSGDRTNIPTGVHDVALTGDPFTNGAGGDFSLNNTAGAGAAVRAAGFPGTFSGIGTTGYADGGAVQHQDSGGAAGMLFIPNLEGT